VIDFVEDMEVIYDAFIEQHEEFVGFRAAHAMWFEMTFGEHWIAAVSQSADRRPYPLPFSPQPVVFSQLSW
jgi:hypothetical protein